MIHSVSWRIQIKSWMQKNFLSDAVHSAVFGMLTSPFAEDFNGTKKQKCKWNLKWHVQAAYLPFTHASLPRSLYVQGWYVQTQIYTMCIHIHMNLCINRYDKRQSLVQLYRVNLFQISSRTQSEAPWRRTVQVVSHGGVEKRLRLKVCHRLFMQKWWNRGTSGVLSN